MKKYFKIVIAIVVCLMFNQTAIFASSHREAPLISNDPLADNTDLYAFRSPSNTNNIVLIANYIPFEHPAGAPNWNTFGSNIRYEIHVDNNASTTGVVGGDDIVYRFTFTSTNQDGTTFFNIRLGQQNIKTVYTLERSTNGGFTFTPIVTNGIVPANNIGPRSIDNAVLGLNVPNYDTLVNRAIMTASTGEKVFCGPADDPFFVDLGGAFDLGGFRTVGARDAVAKFNCHTIAIEVPISTLQKTGRAVGTATNMLDSDFIIGVWASASRPIITTFNTNGGAPTTTVPWIQVSRLGMPLTNEVVVPLGQKDRWNGISPQDAPNEATFQQYFYNPELALYMDNSQFGGAVPGLAALRVQSAAQTVLGNFDFRNGKPGLFPLKGMPVLNGTALANAAQGGFGEYLLPNGTSPRAVDILPIFHTGVPNLPPYQLATGKPTGNPLAPGKPFINNFLPTFGDMLRLNMAVPVTPRNDPNFNSLGLVWAAVLGLTNSTYTNINLQFIPNMDGFPNGRRLEDDVTTIELQAVGGVVLAAIGLWYDDYVLNTTTPNSPVTPMLGNVLGFKEGVGKNDTTFKPGFPYVQVPWRAYTGPGYIGPISPDPALPVKFLEFTAIKSGIQSVQLRWKVGEEVNNDHYEIEYSTDGVRFTNIGRLPSRTGITNSYELLHSSPSLSQVNYYRIKQVDKDGKITYSIIRAVNFSSKTGLTITPNPATTFIKVFTEKADINVSLFDISGKKIASKTVSNGSTNFDISGLAKGSYLVVAEENGIRIESKKVVKQ